MTNRYIEDDAGDLREALEEAVLGWEGVMPRVMFGCPAYVVDGALFALIVNEGIVLTQLPAEDREALASIAHVESFRAGSKLIHRWAQICLKGPHEVELILPYVHRSYQMAIAQME